MKKIISNLIGIVVVITVITVSLQVNAKPSNIPDVVLNNIEALNYMPIDPIGRHCSQGCHMTGQSTDFCTQCGETECLDYFFREPIGTGGQCPVNQE